SPPFTAHCTPSTSTLSLHDALPLSRVSYLLAPAVSFIQYVSLPIIVAAIFYYLTVPLVNRIEERGLNRTWGSAIVLLLIAVVIRSEEHTSELQSRFDLVCRLLLEKK